MCGLLQTLPFQIWVAGEGREIDKEGGTSWVAMHSFCPPFFFFFLISSGLSEPASGWQGRREGDTAGAGTGIGCIKQLFGELSMPLKLSCPTHAVNGTATVPQF